MAASYMRTAIRGGDSDPKLGAVPLSTINQKIVVSFSAQQMVLALLSRPKRATGGLPHPDLNKYWCAGGARATGPAAKSREQRKV